MLIGLAFLVVAASAFQTDDSQTKDLVSAKNATCPTTRPCCSCDCKWFKECSHVAKSKTCDRVRCLYKCPHTCAEVDSQMKELVPSKNDTCPATRPCCSCDCKWFNECKHVPKSKGCDRVKCAFVCPHKCQEVDSQMKELVPSKNDMKDLVPAKNDMKDLVPAKNDTKDLVPAKNDTCPATRPCCSCDCKWFNECKHVPRPRGCDFVRCLYKCPHTCQKVESPMKDLVPTKNDTQTCPTNRPCCTCDCLWRKQCRDVPRPKHCENIKCKYVCTNKCDE